MPLSYCGVINDMLNFCMAICFNLIENEIFSLKRHIACLQNLIMYVKLENGHFKIFFDEATFQLLKDGRYITGETEKGQGFLNEII